MDQMGQKFNTLHNPGPRPCEVRTCIYREYLSLANCREILPTGKSAELGGQFQHLGQMESTRHHDEHLGRPCLKVLPGNPNRVSIFPREFINTSRNPDHFRHPMTAAVQRIQPFHAKYPRTRSYALRDGCYLGKFSRSLVDPALCLLRAARGLADVPQVLKNSCQRFW